MPKTAPHPHAKAKPKTKTVARAKCKVAPADEYFGKLKLSILGIRNTIKDQGLKVDVDPEKASSTFNAIALTEDAIHDWEHKYPCDSWIPGSIFAIEHFYTKIHTADGVRHVHATYAWLRHDFPRHRLVANARREDGSASATLAGDGDRARHRGGCDRRQRRGSRPTAGSAAGDPAGRWGRADAVSRNRPGERGERAAAPGDAPATLT